MVQRSGMGMDIHLVSLGCARNLVDSEIMTGRLAQAGFSITDHPEKAEVIIVNTCSFIESAIDESIDSILELSTYKKKGVCRRLIVVGCLPERFRDEILPSLPEVDIFLGTGAFEHIVEAVTGTRQMKPCDLPDPNASPLQDKNTPRNLSTFPTAYLKIAEGCNKHCTYCIIPKLRGTQKSRPLNDIVAEAKRLVQSGVKELDLVAQDTTAYGRDLNAPGNTLGHLLDALARLSDDVWIRFLYGHPESIDRETIIAVANRPNICSYFDIPVQHASDRMLKYMGRGGRQKDLYRLFEYIRSVLPDAALRTSVMVGFPGETENDVKMLMDFINQVRFDHLGVFVYSDGDDLPSHTLPDPVPADIARERYERIMERQMEISRDHLETYLGRQITVLVENRVEPNLFAARTAFQAPEVDGITYVHSKKPILHTFAPVRITDTLEYDLVGESL